MSMSRPRDSLSDKRGDYIYKKTWVQVSLVAFQDQTFDLFDLAVVRSVIRLGLVLLGVIGSTLKDPSNSDEVPRYQKKIMSMPHSRNICDIKLLITCFCSCDCQREKAYLAHAK